MIGIVDYGAGNLGNVLRAMRFLGHEARLLPNPAEKGIDPRLLVLPGVGAFPPAMGDLFRRGWVPVLKEWVRVGKPLLGICLGMQLLYSGSREDGETEGLGFFPGEVAPLANLEKSPHMGWNRVKWVRGVPGVSQGFAEGLEAYFVHGFAAPVNNVTVAVTTVGRTTFSSISMAGNVAGFQFHPERSGLEGLRFLDAFVKRLLAGNS